MPPFVAMDATRFLSSSTGISVMGVPSVLVIAIIRQYYISKWSCGNANALKSVAVNVD
jgi:hypothetical protein